MRHAASLFYAYARVPCACIVLLAAANFHLSILPPSTNSVRHFQIDFPSVHHPISTSAHFQIQQSLCINPDYLPLQPVIEPQRGTEVTQRDAENCPAGGLCLSFLPFGIYNPHALSLSSSPSGSLPAKTSQKLYPTPNPSLNTIPASVVRLVLG